MKVYLFMRWNIIFHSTYKIFSEIFYRQDFNFINIIPLFNAKINMQLLIIFNISKTKIFDRLQKLL